MKGRQKGGDMMSEALSAHIDFYKVIAIRIWFEWSG